MKTNKHSKFFEYMTIFFAVVGTLAMFAAVGAIEEDKYLLGASAACLGIGSYIMALGSQNIYADKL
jgi:uncharacterized membrane protein YkvI